MNHQSGIRRRPAGGGLIEWARRMGAPLAALALEVYAELKRLNRAPNHCLHPRLNSRGRQIQAFKATLVEHYEEHNHCC